MYLRTLSLAGFALSLFAFPALGHHSFAMFDHGQVLTLNGTVQEFEWHNPHAWLHLTVMDENGNAVTWGFEGGSPGQLTAAGWTPNTVEAGDQIELSFHPLKDGSFGGQLRSVVLPNGNEMCDGAACREGLGVTE